MCELLPQTELEKSILWQCLEIVWLVSFEGGNLMSSRETSRSSGSHLAWRSSVEFLFKDGKS